MIEVSRYAGCVEAAKAADTKRMAAAPSTTDKITMPLGKSSAVASVKRTIQLIMRSPDLTGATFALFKHYQIAGCRVASS